MIEATRVFKVHLAHGRVPLIQILADDRIPGRYTFHPDIEGALLLRIAPRRSGSGNRIVELSCFYTTDWLHDVENPLERPADITWRDTEYQVAALRDLDGKPFVSASGEPLEDIMIETPGEICTVTKNLPGMPKWFTQYRNVVNDGTVRIDGVVFDKGQCRIKSRSLSGWKRENEIDFRTITLEIHMREQGWQVQKLNRGFYELVETNTVTDVDDGNGGTTQKTVKTISRKQILIDGKPAVEPQLLDVTGKAIKFKDAEGNPVPGAGAAVKAAILDFKVRGVKSFNTLPLK